MNEYKSNFLRIEILKNQTEDKENQNWNKKRKCSRCAQVDGVGNQGYLEVED